MDESRRQISQERCLHARVEVNNGRKRANCRLHDLARMGRRFCLQPATIRILSVVLARCRRIAPAGIIFAGTLAISLPGQPL